MFQTHPTSCGTTVDCNDKIEKFQTEVHSVTYWDFHAQPFLGFTKNGVKREKHPVCVSPVGENVLLMLEVRGEWAD